MEPVEHGDHAARGAAAVAAANEALHRTLGAGGLGIRVARVAKFTRWANASVAAAEAAAAAAAAAAAGEDPASLELSRPFTRDGVHARSLPARWVLREVLGELLALLERTPPGERSLRALRVGDVCRA